jgi:hypothetical protein
VTGKRVGGDAAHGKATYPAVLGLDGARAAARDLLDRCLAATCRFWASAPASNKARTVKTAGRMADFFIDIHSIVYLGVSERNNFQGNRAATVTSGIAACR